MTRSWLVVLAAGVLASCMTPRNAPGCGEHRLLVDTRTNIEPSTVQMGVQRILSEHDVGYGLTVSTDPGPDAVEIGVPEETPERRIAFLVADLYRLPFVENVERQPFVACRIPKGS